MPFANRETKRISARGFDFPPYSCSTKAPHHEAPYSEAPYCEAPYCEAPYCEASYCEASSIKESQDYKRAEGPSRDEHRRQLQHVADDQLKTARSSLSL